MLSHEMTHTQLSRTVDNLTEWLSIVEVGLVSMLDNTKEDIIEEEQEDLVIDGEWGDHKDWDTFIANP